jgi:ADP-ribose pyrophosphatase YjhB (NUDIX family)
MHGTGITRYKSVVVPVVQGTQGSKGSPDKYLLVKDKGSGDWTFPGGGCGYVKSRARDQEKYMTCALKEFKEETREAFKGHEKQMIYIGQFDSYNRSDPEKKADKRIGKLGQVRQLYLVYKMPLKELSEEQFEESKEEFKERLKDPKYQDPKYQETNDVGLFTMSELKVLKTLWSRMQEVLPIIEWRTQVRSQCKLDQNKQDTRKRLSSQLKTVNRWTKSKKSGW